MRRLLPWVAMGAALATTSGTQAHPPDHEQLLRETWSEYVGHFVQNDGRVVDRSGGSQSTSEGQAYAMLRSVWLDDRQTFDRARSWSINNLQKGNPAVLPAWQWGRREDDTWGIIDSNPASDADQLMAYALLMAATRWEHPTYRGDALALMEHIWEEETLVVAGRRVMLPGPWAAHDDPIHINPSYLMPFVYREFAKVDDGRPWMDLVTSSYRILEASVDAYGLPPDWCFLDRETGALLPPPEGEEAKLYFGFEALRVPWNLAADVQWYDDNRARVLLARVAHLGETWRRTGRVPSKIAPGGQPVTDKDYVGMYGAMIPAWYHVRPDDAHRLYRQNVESMRSGTGWGREDDYYAQNWVWFGIALWSRLAIPPEAL